MTKKEKRSIELTRRFALPEGEIDESAWRQWVPDKEVDLGEKIEVVKRYADGLVITSENAFLLHSGLGITGGQCERSGYSINTFSDYARLLHGLRTMTATVATWKDDLQYRAQGNWRPLLTLSELQEDGYGDLAESIRTAIIQGWIDGKNDLPPGMRVVEWLDEREVSLQKPAGAQTKIL